MSASIVLSSRYKSLPWFLCISVRSMFCNYFHCCHIQSETKPPSAGAVSPVTIIIYGCMFCTCILTYLWVMRNFHITLQLQSRMKKAGLTVLLMQATGTWKCRGNGSEINGLNLTCFVICCQWEYSIYREISSSLIPKPVGGGGGG